MLAARPHTSGCDRPSSVEQYSRETGQAARRAHAEARAGAAPGAPTPRAPRPRPAPARAARLKPAPRAPPSRRPTNTPMNLQGHNDDDGMDRLLSTIKPDNCTASVTQQR